MAITLTYKNELGEVKMKGSGQDSFFKITAIEGLGLVSREYNAAVYSGYDGQETLSSRATARSITIALEALGKNAAESVRDALGVFSQSGMLYIKSDNLDRRIYCNQVQIPDVTRVLRGQIATFAVQFVCDSPFFEDSIDTVLPLYKRTKLLAVPFSLPAKLGEIVLGGEIEIKGMVSVEPIITIYYPVALEGAESIILTNETTGKSVQLDYAPKNDDMVTIDIKNRKIISSVSGNIINNLSTDTFLGDFVLVRGVNVISVNVGDVTAGFTIECKHNNLYSEAVIV
ncbi:MAG: phage tail family protein [Clostridia bacterium]|nr:phage tail family protein [Clostridia bacterium]